MEVSKLKRVLISLLLVSLLLNSSSAPLFAKVISNSVEEKENHMTIGKVGGYLEGNRRTVENLNIERKFTYDKGHGFAAERANNLSDVLKGKNATVVGDDNAKNGPDRKIINRNGDVMFIQDKYYSEASRSVAAAFDEELGFYKYVDATGNPMQLEVPADQYEKAVNLMAKKIELGKVAGVTDTAEATNIVRKGKITYQQAVNLTKAGNIDSLKYDATNGMIVATSALGISFVIDYSLGKINGLDNQEALKEASLNGLKNGGYVFATYVISSQLAKTGLPKAMAPLTDAIAVNLGKGISESILQIHGIETAELSTMQIAKQISKVMQNQIITGGVFVVVLTTPDILELFKGRISREQLLQNLVVTVFSLGGTYVGSVTGGALGTIVVPGAGTMAGSLVGGVAGGSAAAFVAKYGLKTFLKSDSDKMYEILSNEFSALSSEYIFTEQEVSELVEQVKKALTEKTLKDMYQSKDRETFAKELMQPLFEKEIASREKVVIPTEEESRVEMMKTMRGIIFVH